MGDAIRNTTFRGNLKLVLLSLLMLVITFPFIEPVIAPHLDSSYLLAYNYLFVHDIEFLQYLTFTFGPLAFIKHPLPIGSNLEIGLISQAVIQFLFILLSFRMAYRHKKRPVLYFILIFFFTSLLAFDYVFYGLIVLLLFFHHEKRNINHLIYASFFVALGLLIKVNVSLIGVLLFGSYLITDLLMSKKWSNLISGIGFSLVFYMLLWLLVYGNFAHFWRYIHSLLVLTFENSSSLTLLPDNDWLLLSASLITLFLVPLLQKDRITWIIYAVFFLALFASFKYAFAREDTYHIKTLFDFLLLFIFVLILLNKKLKMLSLSLLVASLFLFHENTRQLETNEAVSMDSFAGFNNFNREVLHFSTWKADALESSMENTAGKELPEIVKKLVGDNTIDFYPWEISWAYANELNYKPRPMLQSGALPVKIDKLNAKFISSDEAADFMLWEFNEEGRLASYDERYQLNSEGNYLNAFFDHYDIIYKNEDFALYRKTEDTVFSVPEALFDSVYLFDEWIDVPPYKEGILKAKIDFSRTFKGSLLSFFYKDGLYFIEYKLENGAVIKHRFSPGNATSGLWISPYLIDLNNELSGFRVKQIRISQENPENVLRDEFGLTWENIDFKRELLKEDLSDTVPGTYLAQFNGFEDRIEGWKYGFNSFDTRIVFSGMQSYRLDSVAVFSPSYTIYPHEVLDTTNALLVIDLMAYPDSLSRAVFVIATENDEGLVDYTSHPLLTEYTMPLTWNSYRFTKTIQPTSDSTLFVKLYIWGSKGELCYIDDLRYSLMRF